MEDGGHEAHPYLDVGVGTAQGVDEGEVVGDELVAVVGPVARVGVIEAEVYDGLVGDKGDGIAVSLLLGVGAVSVVKKSGTRVTKVAHLIARSQHLTQTGGIGGLRGGLMSIAIGNAVAYAGYANGGTGKEMTCKQGT